MSEFVTAAQALRTSTTAHYNCCQSVLLPFAARAGISEKQALAIAANFGSGMKMGSVCGAITGGLMVLGLFGVEDGPSVNEYYTALRTAHEGLLNCADLLRVNKERGGQKGPHCDAMVYECVTLAENMLKARGLL